jgi:hypothetical protein
MFPDAVMMAASKEDACIFEPVPDPHLDYQRRAKGYRPPLRNGVYSQAHR